MSPSLPKRRATTGTTRSRTGPARLGRIACHYAVDRDRSAEIADAAHHSDGAALPSNVLFNLTSSGQKTWSRAGNGSEVDYSNRVRFQTAT